MNNNSNSEEYLKDRLSTTALYRRTSTVALLNMANHLSTLM